MCDCWGRMGFFLRVWAMPSVLTASRLIKSFRAVRSRAGSLSLSFLSEGGSAGSGYGRLGARLCRAFRGELCVV